MRDEKGPRISVIVPVYQAEKYLKECVESILRQTFRDLEVILVDDGSRDESPAICDAFARKDPRVRVIHQENGGVSVARNVGVAAAESEYLGFVDSDDVILPQMYEQLLFAAEKYGAEVTCCGFQVSNGVRILETKAMAPEKAYTPEEALREMFLSREMHVVLWNKLYRSETLKKVHFPEGETYEDGAVMYRILGDCERVAHCGACGYIYRKGQPSITKNAAYLRMKREVLANLAACRAYVEEKYPALGGELSAYELETLYYVAAKYIQGGGSARAPEYREVCRRIRERFSEAVRHPGWGLRKKMQVVLLLAGLYGPLWRTYHRLRLAGGRKESEEIG